VISTERRLLELGFKGERQEVERAMTALIGTLSERAVEVRSQRPS